MSVLLVEDDPDSCRAMQHAMEKRGIQLLTAMTLRDGWATFQDPAAKVDAVVTDVRLGNCSGIELLRQIRECDPDLPVILITGFDTLESAIEAIHLGAQDYILKPLDKIEDLLIPLNRAVRHHRTLLENRALNIRLAQSERRFREFFENEPEYCYMVSPDGVIQDVNRAALTALGYDESELIGQSVKTIYAPEDLERASDLLSRWKRTGVLRDEEMSIVGKSGQKRRVLLNASAVRDEAGNILHSVSIQCDITERKKAETELLKHRDRLRQLSLELTLAEEKQRRRIAVELHDGLSVDICCAIRQMRKAMEFRDILPPQVLSSLESIEQTLSNSLEGTRSLMFDLFPPSLFVAGLPAALEDLAEHVTHKWGVHLELECPEELERLVKDDRILLYRAARELLENVGRHAQARNVRVETSLQEGMASVEVRDDGKGFDPLAPSGKGIGLISIKERMISLGGTCCIESAPGKGCRVVVTMPAHMEEKEQ